MQWRLGRSGGDALLFVTNTGPAMTATFTAASLFDDVDEARDLVSGVSYLVVQSGAARSLAIGIPEGGHALLHWPASDATGHTMAGAAPPVA